MHVPRRDAAHQRIPVRLGLGLALAAVCVGSPGASQVFRSGTQVVPVYATVTDSRGVTVRDLVAADFEIRDNGTRRPITVFKNDIQPITIAILLDTSPSLMPAVTQTTAAVVEFAKRLLPADRACLGTFGQTVTLDARLTASPEALVRRLDSPTPWPAGTAIWDAIEAGRSALVDEGGRRVVLIVSDGADNASRVNPDDTRTALQREGVMVYAIGIRGRSGLDASELGALARATGGRWLELPSTDDLSAAMQGVADELHHQYVVGFSPGSPDDKLHRLEVTVKRRGLTVRARRSYFASKAEIR